MRSPSSAPIGSSWVAAHYLDGSALVKLAIEEAESGPLRRFVIGSDLVTSIIAAVEVPRAARRVAAGDRRVEEKARHAVDEAVLLELDSHIIERANDVEPETLPALDAIHLATALAYGERLEAFVCYDVRLADAARAAGLSVASPQ